MRHYSWLLLLFIPGGLFAQRPLYEKFRHFGVDDGLPQNLVTGIVQDTDGFLWISTKDGIARYDGNEFLPFRHQPDNSNSLASNATDRILCDSRNQLWIMLERDDINKLDPRTQDVERSEKLAIPLNQLKPVKLIQDFPYDPLQAPRLMIELLDPANARIKEFLVTGDPQADKRICAAAEDARKNLWLLTGQGLEVSDASWQTFERIPFPKEIQFDPKKINFKPRLFHLVDQRIGILLGNKVILYEPTTKQLKIVTAPTASDKPENKLRINYSSFTKDSQGRFVFEYQNAIYRLEDDDKISLLWTNEDIAMIRCIFIDHSNTLWVGTDPNGLYKIDLLTPTFESHRYQHDFITDVLVNELGINPQVIRRDTVLTLNAYLARYTYPEHGTLALYYQTVIQGPFGHVLTSIKDRSLKVVHRGTDNAVIALAPDKKIWSIDEQGVLRKWADLSRSPSIKKINLPPRTPIVNDNSAGTISDLLVDDDQYWISTRANGIFQYKNDQLVTTIQPHGKYYTNVLSRDPTHKNILWIGTITGGLYKWDKITGKLLATYNESNGLPNNTINSLVLDSLGYMWISTNKGIVRFNPTQERFTHYTVADGLIESEFNRHHDLLLPDGRIAMGGVNGYSIFHPRNYAEDNFSPRVFITKFSINERMLDHRIDTTILPAPINHLEELILSYSNNTLAFEIAALQFNAPEKIKFRYRLKGFDENWVNTTADRPIRFARLPSGNYTLLLNASNTNGSWSDDIRELGITVQPPFWLTWWAYSFYFLATALAIRLLWLRYKKRLIARQEAIFNTREAARLRELDETKTRFFSNVTHEFRTPLTLILTPLEKHLNDPSLPPKALTLLNNNYRHANQLLKLVNQLLDIAKLEAGQMRMNATAGEFAVFIEQCVASFQVQANEKGIDLAFANPQVDGHFLFDHEKWEKILFNLISNSVKFTPAGGTVRVTLSHGHQTPTQRGAIRVAVEDSGTGIKDEDLPKIFERFYQADDSASRKHEGTGIGLSLVRELVQLMGGTIHVSSVQNKGTIFIIEVTLEQLGETPSAQGVASLNPFRLADQEVVPGIDHDTPLILIIDDNEELRSFVKESLSPNWRVLDASNGFDGWTIIQNELPEIVVSDIMMPGMTGLELCAKSKQDPRTNHINFIMLTARAAQESKIEGLESGADDYITKPFRLYELELRIKNLLIEQYNLRTHLFEKLVPTNPTGESLDYDHPFLRSLHQVLDRHLRNSELTVDFIAHELAMSKSTLNRKMKALLSTPIVEYLKHYRLNCSIPLLRKDESVSQVAIQVGFESASYFTQCFKDRFGKVPSDYRPSRRTSGTGPE